ncbi:MAG: polymorphic toxin-type HINT domain-containing protein [Polyangiaceae bacterium]|nr:polymorphic toxin-type HINT domain-containing protein [Polyangiaceae bacterium]
MRIGDEVVSRDALTGENSLRPVVQVFARLSDALVDVHVTSPEGQRETIRSTPEHPYWSRERGWVQAGLLREGERLVTATGGELEVTEVVALDAQAPVFNLEVDRTHTYFAGALGAWVHNVCFGPPQVGTGALPSGPVKDIFNGGKKPAVPAGNFTPNGEPIRLNPFDRPGDTTHVKPDVKNPANKGGFTPFTPVAPGKGTVPAQIVSVRPGGSSDVISVKPDTQLLLTDCLSGCTVAVKPGQNGQPDQVIHINPPKNLSDERKEEFVNQQLAQHGFDPNDDRNTIVRPIDYGWTGEVETGSSSGGFFYGQRDPVSGEMKYYLVEYKPDGTVKASREVSPKRDNPKKPDSTPPQCTLAGGCGGPGQCFTAGTLVLTPAGAVPIEQLRAGDEVLSPDQATGAISHYLISTAFERTVEALVDVELRGPDGQSEVIRSTPEHPYWSTLRGWVEAANLQPGETLQSASGQQLWARAVVPLSAEAKVYNLEVAQAHTYFVGEHQALVHNDCTVAKLPNFRDVETPKKFVEWVIANQDIDADDRKALEDRLKALGSAAQGYNGYFDAADPKVDHAQKWSGLIANFAGGDKNLTNILKDSLGLLNPSEATGSGTLRVNEDGSLAGRPAFTQQTATAVPVTAGQHRRHIVAWHTIKDYLNQVREDPAVEKSLHYSIQRTKAHELYALEKKVKEKEKELASVSNKRKSPQDETPAEQKKRLGIELAQLRAERDAAAKNHTKEDRLVVNDLLEAEAAVAKLSEARASAKPPLLPLSAKDELFMKAAIMMNSNRHNLWAGKGQENSTINAVAGSLEKKFNDIKEAASPKDALVSYLQGASQADPKKSPILNASNRLAAERAIGSALDLHGPKPSMSLREQQQKIDDWMAGKPVPEIDQALNKLTANDAKGVVEVLHREIILTHEIDVLAHYRPGMTAAEIETARNLVDAAEIMHGVRIDRNVQPGDHQHVIDTMLPSVRAP